MRGFHVVNCIKNHVKSTGGNLLGISAIGNITRLPQNLRVDLHGAGVLLQEVPPGKPNEPNILNPGKINLLLRILPSLLSF
jgi:hypothetical protein